MTEIYLKPKERLDIFAEFEQKKMINSPDKFNRYLTICNNKSGNALYIIHLGKKYSLNRFYEELDKHAKVKK